LTSLDPLKIYMYDDGLIRIATELYNEEPDSILDPCIHVTNFDINKKNKDKFIYNYEPQSCNGHKWRLKVLWRYFAEIGLQEHDFDYIWNQIEEAVIKSILIALPEMRREYSEMVDISCYNSYKLLGYDMMIDNDLKVHVLEVNGRPQLKNDVLDKAVNRPMLAEMLKIIGYHIPREEGKSGNQRQFISEKFQLGPEYGSTGNASKYPIDHVYTIYSRVKIEEDVIKQKKDVFQELNVNREDYLDAILKDLSPMDVRTLVKSEEELSQTKSFTRIFPRNKSHHYFKYYYAGIPYYDKLLDAWEHHFGHNRIKGIKYLRKYCNKAVHL